jgi:hypothetical protein
MTIATIRDLINGTSQYEQAIVELLPHPHLMTTHVQARKNI